MNTPTQVLLITGSGRSGSTLLDLLMAGVDGCTAVGELRYLWERGVVEDRLCGCGERFSECPFWQAVVAQAFGGAPPDAQRMIALQNRGTRMRQLPATFATGGRGARRLEEYPRVMSDVVRAIAEVSGARTVVDSSKLPPYGGILERAPGIDLRVVHLVRDPRATAYSWGQRKQQPDRGSPGVMQIQGPLKSAALWSAWNAAAELLGRRLGARYLRLRYEDLITDPATSLRAVTSLIGTSDATLPLVDAHHAQLVPSHTVAGNPDRFHDGQVELRLDERWKQGLTARDAFAVSMIGAPLMKRYGYPIGSTR